MADLVFEPKKKKINPKDFRSKGFYILALKSPSGSFLCTWVELIEYVGKEELLDQVSPQSLNFIFLSSSDNFF